MEQSRIESKVEATLNTASGFLISLGMWAYVVNPLIVYGFITLDNNVIIVSMFTVTSVLRSYYWRRFFARRIHLVLHRWVSKFFQLTGWY